MKELPAYKATKAAVIADLCRRAQRGDVAARNAVIEANLRLCARIATRYARNHGRLDLLDDLIHEAAFGERGLVRAIERFDPSRSTFAQRAGVYITDAVVTLLKSQQSTTRRGSAKRRARIRSVSDTLEVQLGRRPSSEEVRLHFVGLGGSWVPSLQSIERAVGWSLSEVSYTENELDGPTREHDPSACLDHTAPSEDDLIARIDGERQREALASAMAQLDSADRALLARRFGIGTRDAPTANKLRPNEAAALQRLREIITGAKHQ